MKITSEVNLRNFDFWSGGKDNAIKLTCEQLDEIEIHLEDIIEEPSETDINDMFWFEFKTILECIGLKLCEKCNEIYEDFCECE